MLTHHDATPLEKYKAFLDEAGVPYTEEISTYGPDNDEEHIEIGVDDNTGPNVRWVGYGGFCFSFIFSNKTGELAQIGSWE